MDFLKDLSIDKVRNIAEDAFNQAKPKTEVEARVYEVLSHKNWGSSSTLLNEIAKDSFDYDKFAVISQLMWEAMENQRPAAWRVVFKGLNLVEHLVKNGSERCVDDARNHGHSLRALHKFNYYEGTVDRGLGVREKSKQLVEMLSDDERVREERQRARKMREKLGKLSGVSGGGGAYAGYGNDNWNSSSGGGGGGYGQGGIGSESSRSGGAGSSGRYGGRYDEDTRSPAPAADPQPTFATLPDAVPKKTKKIKKKKSATATPAAAPVPAPEVDLFSFDSAPAPAPETASEEFAAFQSAGPTAAPAPVHDPFAAAPAPAAAPANFDASFDAFGGSQATQNNASFDAFGNNGGMNTNNNVGGNMGMMQQPMGGGMPANNMGMMQQPMGMMQGQPQQQMAGGMMQNGAMMQNQPSNGADDDDFGDFEGASTPAPAPSFTAVPAPSKPADPMSKLISLDGLAKNAPRKVNNLNQPVVANHAANQFMQNQGQIQSQFQQQSTNASFAGIDGMPKNNQSGMAMMNPAMGTQVTTGVMAGGADAISSIFDPASMKQQAMMANQHQQQAMAGSFANMGQPQMGNQMGMNPNMQGQMGMNNQMGMMNPNMQGQMGMNNQMGGQAQMGMNPNMQGQMGMNPNMGMMNPNMQGQMGMNQQQMMMNNQGMQGGFGMQNGNMNQMGGFR